jgi:hypothetical protein
VRVRGTCPGPTLTLSLSLLEGEGAA